MTQTQDWRTQVAEWRASGLSAEEFSKQRGYPRSRLWAWSARLRREQQQTPVAEGIPLARVVPSRAEPGGAALTLQVHDVRIEVRPGFDRAVLVTVLDVVGE